MFLSGLLQNSGEERETLKNTSAETFLMGTREHDFQAV